MGKDSKVSREKKNLSSNSRTLHRTIPNKETITKPSQKSWGWHATQALDWAAKTIFGATVLTVISKIPGAVATALPNLSNLQYSHQRTDARSSALMRRALPICNNASTQISQWFPGGSQPFFATVNGSMVTAASGSISGSAYQRIGVNSFNVNNIPLLLNDLAVDANTWSADRPFIIATEGGPVFLYETVAAATQCYVVPYTNSLVAAGSIQTLPSSIFYNHRNPRGAALNGGGFCGTFETNDIVGGTNYQIAIRFFGRDNFTPINPAETRVSTNGTTINKNSWVGVNPDNSGTVVWQEQIGTTNHIAFNSFNSTFAFSNEGTATDNTLKSYDCVNPKLIQVPNGQWKLVFLGSPTVGTSTYNFYIQNVTLFPTFQLMGKPVNVTANQSVTFYQGADYGVMPTENNGLRIAVSTFPPASGLRAFVINVNSDNTINGGINAVDPNATTQSGMTITGFDDGSYTIGYQCNTNICYQTYSIKPNLNTPNTIPVNEAAIGQVINIPGFSVQQTTYSRGQLSVTLTISPSIMVLSTTTPTPPNATVTYDSNTGALTFVTNGVGNCQTDMNNLLCGLQGAVQAYERQSGNL